MEWCYSKARKYLGTLENTNPTLLARFPNLATLERVNLIVGFTIKGIVSQRQEYVKIVLMHLIVPQGIIKK